MAISRNKCLIEKGQHPAIIDLETFTKANNILGSFANAGIPKQQKHEELPLKVFVKDAKSDSPITGFQQKNIWYYKARATCAKLNVSAKHLNEVFKKYLSQFEYNSNYTSKLKAAINAQLTIKLADSLKENALLKKRISELKNQMEILEEKYILDRIEAALYEKFHTKYSMELSSLNTELSKNQFESSNLENIIDKGLQITRNLSTAWASSDFDNKQKLQYLVFPEGIKYCKKMIQFKLRKSIVYFA